MKVLSAVVRERRGFVAAAALRAEGRAADFKMEAMVLDQLSVSKRNECKDSTGRQT